MKSIPLRQAAVRKDPSNFFSILHFMFYSPSGFHRHPPVSDTVYVYN